MYCCKMSKKGKRETERERGRTWQTDGESCMIWYGMIWYERKNNNTGGGGLDLSKATTSKK